MQWVEVFIMLSLAWTTLADVYLHNPRGSNNRLDEKTRERANANRMFDSQNNNRGGYNVGSLYYYPGSVLPVEWTNQHSCGEANSHCELILQYMCSENLRDGTKTTTIPLKHEQCKNNDCNSDLEYGMQEDHDYYLHCKYRERNKALFTADQNLKNRNTAINTRQNPAGTRRGYECPEERDYYPYWRPSPWKDIVIMTNDVNRCKEYQEESQNVKSRFICQPPPGYLKARLNNKVNQILPNNKLKCEKIVYNGNNATWTEIPAHNIPPPDCQSPPKSRDNHNGNGVGAFPTKYNWTIPNDVNENCALRLRYNISTGDYPWETNSKYNNNNPKAIDIAKLVGLPAEEAKSRGYIFKGNPVVKPLKKKIGNVDVGAKLQLLLAVNTAQFGRTFQDRSHSFQIRARPNTIDANTRIHNLNVRGKRGNIVQVYPAVEYDFVPNRLQMNIDDYIHIQWTGSNTNPPNNDGQGLRGTDRNNMIVLKPSVYHEGQINQPIPENEKYGHFGRNFPDHLDSGKFLALPWKDRLNLAILTPGQLKGELSELDDAGTYFDLGVRKITSNGTGTYHYMCTRNNNFSNRGQKGKIVVNSIYQIEALFGWNGGKLTMPDGNEKIWIEKGMMKQSKNIAIYRWESKAGEKVLESHGGSITDGSGYESKFFVVEPFGDLVDGEGKLKIQMRVDSSRAKLYHSLDYKTWQDVDFAYDDHMATFSTQKGGIFVARTNNLKRNIIIGSVVGVLAVAVLVLGFTVYYRRNPEQWRYTKKGLNDIHLSAKSKI